MQVPIPLCHVLVCNVVPALFIFRPYVALYLQLATVLIFGWWEEGTILRVEWRCASRDSGGQCVMTTGIPVMQWLPADSLVSPQNVSGSFWVEATACLVLPVNLFPPPLQRSICIINPIYFALVTSYCTQKIDMHMVAARIGCKSTVVGTALQKQVGCFNHRVVTMVANKLKVQWL